MQIIRILLLSKTYIFIIAFEKRWKKQINLVFVKFPSNVI